MTLALGFNNGEGARYARTFILSIFGSINFKSLIEKCYFCNNIDKLGDGLST